MSAPRRRRGGRRAGPAAPPERTFDYEDPDVLDQMDGALWVLRFLIDKGGSLGRTVQLISVFVVLGGVALLALGISPGARWLGAGLTAAGVALFAQGFVMSKSALTLTRALSVTDRRVRPVLMRMAIVGLPFFLTAIALAGVLLWAVMQGDVPSPRALIVVGAVVFVGAGVPSVALFGHVRYRAFYEAMDGEVV